MIYVNKENIIIDSSEYSDTFGNIINHHFYKEWVNVKNKLKKLGFVLKTQKYHIDNNWAKPYNKVGFKSDGVSVTLELKGSNIELVFGNNKNLWADSENNFWTDWHANYKGLTYLETKSIELSIRNFLRKYPNETIEYRKEHKGADFIINLHKKSLHCKDASKLDELGLEGVKYQMSEWDFGNNSLDKNNKKIQCGDVKYFYHKNKLMRGQAYHSLNNMWLLLCNGEVTYVSSFNLFNYDGHSTKRCFSKTEVINILNEKLKILESKREYEKCAYLYKHVLKLKQKRGFYKVYSIKWGNWWLKNNAGYTNNESDAGIYLADDVLNNQNYYNDGVNKLVKID